MNEPSTGPRLGLTRLRRGANLSQRQLADALGLKSVRAVTAWENGSYAPGVQHLIPLSNILGVSVREVVEAITGQIANPMLEGLDPDRGHESNLRPELEQLVWHLAEMDHLVRALQKKSDS